MYKLKKIKIELLIVAATLIGAMCLFSSNLKAELNIDSLKKAMGYYRVDDFREGMARVFDYVRGSNHYWFIDKEGKEYWKERNYSLAGEFYEGMARVEKDGIMFFIDKEGNEYWKDRKYISVGSFREGMAWVRNPIFHYWFIDKNGTEYWKERNYNGANDFLEGMAPVQQDLISFFIDKEGTEYWKERKYKDAWNFRNGWANVGKGNYWWYIDKEGNEYLKEKEYDLAYPFNSEGLARVTKDFKTFIINKQGEIIKILK